MREVGYYALVEAGVPLPDEELLYPYWDVVTYIGTIHPEVLRPAVEQFRQGYRFDPNKEPRLTTGGSWATFSILGWPMDDATGGLYPLTEKRDWLLRADSYKGALLAMMLGNPSHPESTYRLDKDSMKIDRKRRLAQLQESNRKVRRSRFGRP